MTAAIAVFLAGALTFVAHDTFRFLPGPLLLLADLIVFGAVFVYGNRWLKKLKEPE